MDDGDDLVAKLSKLSEPEIDILCKHVSLMDVFPTFQKWIQMTHGEQDLEFGDSNADRACQLHDFTHFMDSMQGETWDAFQVLLNIKSGGLVSSAASGADKSTVVDLGKPNPSQAAEHVDTTMEKISPEASLPDTLPAQFPEKNDEAPAYEAKSPPPAKPMASSAAKSPTMLPPSVPKQSEALAKNASPVPALQPPIPKPIEAVAKSISAAAPPPKATPPGEEEPKGAKPTAMKSAQTSSKAMTSVSVEASSTEKTDKVDVAGGKATMETIGGVPVAKSPVAKPTTKAKAAAEPDNTAKPIPAAKAKTMSVPKAKAKADATPTPSVAEETTKKKRHSKQDQVDNFFNISQRKASKDKEPKTPKTSTSKASAKGKTKK